MQITGVVKQATPDTGRSRLVIEVVTDEGLQTSVEVIINPARTVAQLNSDIATKVRDELRTVHGLTVATNEPFTLYGGAVKV